jgi:enterochelin esterase-like enzyme
MANSLMVMLEEYAPALKQMKAIHMSVGLSDNLVTTNRDMDLALTKAGVQHHFETFDGDHDSQVGINFETKVLPMLSKELTFPK